MEQLQASVPKPERLVSPTPQDGAQRILLLDCDNRRREVRAEALMERGVFVDRAAETAVARTLWKSGAYDLVLIDLRGADADCAAFIAWVQDECSHQKFGFYVTQRPYITASAAACRRSMHQLALRSAATDHHPTADPNRGPGGTSLSTAVRRIAALRQSAHFRAQLREEPQAAEVREERFSGDSLSDAARHASRVLGGS
jgi:CheY-like chemotaxis protein